MIRRTGSLQKPRRISARRFFKAIVQCIEITPYYIVPAGELQISSAICYNDLMNMQDTKEQFANKLLHWYADHQRVLPWREDPSPYHVWLSEIMLQQTRVEAVIAYYHRFLAALPDIPALAAADEDTCLKLWEGLGYYRRVRSLHRAAKLLVEQYDGRLPSTREALLQLPGIGDYTASAIASIAFGQQEAAIDGNLLRIFSRLTAYGENILATAAHRKAKEFFTARISKEHPGAFNQELMDLGAGICLPHTAPHCSSCPLAAFCRAHACSRENDFPHRPPKKKRSVEKRTVFLIHVPGGVLLHRRAEDQLLGGLPEFPNLPGWLSQKEALDHVTRLGFEPLRITSLPAAKHIFTHLEWHMHGYEIHTGDWQKKPGIPEGYFTADNEAIETIWSIPSAFAVYRKHLLGK